MEIYIIGYYVQQSIFMIFGKVVGVDYMIYTCVMYIRDCCYQLLYRSILK